MPPTRDFIESVRERAQSDPDFKGALLREALSCILNGEADIGRILMSDYIEVASGFAELARLTGESLENLKFMFSDDGTAQADDLIAVISAIAEHENIELDLHVAPRTHSEQLVEA